MYVFKLLHILLDIAGGLSAVSLDAPPTIAQFLFIFLYLSLSFPSCFLYLPCLLCSACVTCEQCPRTIAGTTGQEGF